MFEPLDRLFQDGLREGVFSGASLLAAAPGKILLERQWGHTQSGGTPVSQDTRFDLASLTKVLVTTPLAIRAVSTGALDLDRTLDAFFPPGSVPPDKRGISVRHLLNHCSGLPAWHPCYLDLIGLPAAGRKAALLSTILGTPLASRPGTLSCYSDLGFLLLGAVLERVLGGPLDRLARELIFKPFGIDELHFRPMSVPRDPEIVPEEVESGRGLSFAATEQCGWRKRLLVGEVHDENCYCLGGVAPHAGLFGTARGVFRLVTRLLDIAGGRSDAPGWSPGVLAEFSRRQELVPGSTWALGFDTPSDSSSSAGRCFSARSIGHLGFSGTSLWIDLDRSVMVVLLTNRIYPTRHNEKLKPFRPLAQDAVMEWLHASEQL